MRILLFGRRKKKKAPEQFSHVNRKGVRYYLFKKAVTLRGGKEVDIYFFQKDPNYKSTLGKPAQKIYTLPKSLEVMENPRNGFLTIRRLSDEREDEE